MKTSELTGAALDWAVAKCEGFSYERYECNRKKWENGSHKPQHWQPSTNWAQGGPIIEREQIDTFNQDNGYAGAIKMATDDNPHPTPYFGPTPLIAAMRCYVASKLGDDVDVPEELQ